MHKIFDEKIFAASQYNKEREYWVNKLSGLVKTFLPSDVSASGAGIRQIETIKFQFPTPLFKHLVEISNNSDFRLHIVLVTGLNLLVYKYTCNNDIIVGTPIAKQNVEGEFINTILPLRNQFNEQMCVKEFLMQVRQTVIETNNNQNYPVETIPYELGIPVVDGEFPLFDIAILLQNIQDRKYLRNINLNIIFSFLRTENSLEGAVEYNASIFKRETIDRIVNHFVHLMHEAFFHVDLKLIDIPVLSEEEKKWMVFDLNNTASDYPSDKVIHRLFEEQAARTPHSIAVESREEILTYQELNDKANQLARLLIEKGIANDITTAIMLETSLEVPLAIIAVLKAGGAYLPIGNEYPDERIDYMLKDSRAKLLLTRESLVEGKTAACHILFLEDESNYTGNNKNLELENNAHSLAYIIYTSGTTGQPKGVMIEHRGLVNYIWWAVQAYVKNEQVDFPLHTSISFDLTVTSIFTPLITGNAIIVYGGVNKKFYIEDMIDENRVGVVKLTPSHLKLIRSKNVKGSRIKRLIVGGEELDADLARDIYNHFDKKIEIYNEYGPTETVVGSMIYKYDPMIPYRYSVPIGVPIANTRVYLLNRHLQVVPVGVEGELYIGGAGLARGYLYNPGMTEEKFLVDPFIPGQKMYKTGDLAVRLPDGNIEYKGRVDHQIKIRGYRIEAGEIEAKILDYLEKIHCGKEKAGCVVLDVKDEMGEKALCAYVFSDKELDASELRKYLSIELPDYMIPTYYKKIDRIPLTPAGKIDRRALPKPELTFVEEYVAPRDAFEEKLTWIWSDVLGLEKEKISIDANFFEVGGHSLRATYLAAAIHKQFDVKLPLVKIFESPTIRGQAELVNTSTQELFTSIDCVEEKEYYPLSSAQERMFIIQRMDMDSIGYNVPIVYEIEGRLSAEKLSDIFLELIQRHENLRTSFILIDDKPVQRIHNQLEFEIEYFDVTGIESSPLQDAENQQIINRFIRPFDFSQAPLLRVGLIRTDRSNHRHILMMDIHHILTDGVSMEILLKEIGALYIGHRLSPLKLRYKDFSDWQSNEKVKKEMKKQEAYWVKQFEGEIPALELPTDFPRPTLQSLEGNHIHFSFDNREIKGLRDLATAQGATLFMVILSLYNIFLSKASGQEDIIIGSSIAGRRHKDLEYIVGIFINTLALRNFPKAEKSFLEFLQEVRINTLNAYENQEYQYEDLVTQIAVRRDTSRNPLMDTMFELNNVDSQFLDIPKFEIPDLKITPYKSNFLISKMDIVLNGLDIGENLSFGFEYSTKLFKKETIWRFIGYFRQLVISVLANPLQTISEIEILSEEEKNRLLNDFCKTKEIYPMDKTIHRLFNEQVERTPDRVALIGRIQITYRELDEKSNRLAAWLRKEGVQPDTIVGVMAERSVEMLIGVLGIFKSGGAYLPIDPDYPKERIDYMLNDSGGRILLTDDLLVTLFMQAKQLDSQCSESYLCQYAQPNHLAYIIYTSGSTGKPKGAMVEHIGMINHIQIKIHDLELDVDSIVAQIASQTFDISIWQFFAALVVGGKIVIYPHFLLIEPDKFIYRVIRDQITILEVVPSYLTLLLNSIERFGITSFPIKFLLVTGEELKSPLVKKWFKLFPEIKMVNAYGPTEASDDITHYIMEKAPDIEHIPIGKPLQNLNIYIVDEHMNLCPIGIKGEICVSGIGVGRGYLNDEMRTKQVFMEDPFLEERGVRLYKTGDLGRWLSNGAIEFWGRKDYQVKIRGFRIECGEIENRLLKFPGIKEAVVIDKDDKQGNKYLCAYLTCGENVNISILKDYLSNELPGYMAPSFFVKLDKIPLTSNGKIDRKALLDPEGINLRDDSGYIPPSSAVEKKLIEIWEKVLGRNNIGVNENFFMIGGDSIKSIQIISRMSSAGYKLEMKYLFQYPIISELAPHIKKLKRIIDQSTITGIIPLTPIQRTFFNEFGIDTHYYNQAVMLHSKEGFDKEAIKDVFFKIQEHHDALRMTFKRDEARGEVIQVNHGLDYPVSIDEYDLKNCENSSEEFNAKVNEIQASINLEKGPLMKLGLWRLNDGDRLLIVIHHLVTDGVSWRILFEDIETLYGQYKRGEKLVLPSKTDSFKFWSETCSIYANDKTFLKEKAYWVKLESTVVPEIKKDFEVEENYVKDTRSISFSLGKEKTDTLITKVNEVFRTEMNDILLTVLGLCIKETFAQDQVLVALEGHGREEIFEDINISRTVGWFTSLYPVLMDISYADDLGRQIKEIKETLRRIPNKGVGYGILKHLTGEENKKEIEFKLKPQISFNYLGQFDADIKQVSFFEMAKESTGNSQSQNNKREYLIDISGITANNRLTMTISYNKTHFKPETMDKLIKNFETELIGIIEFCSVKEAIERTPADFTYKRLSIESVDRFMSEYPEIVDIYTLTPMQEGMLFHALMDNSSHSYFEQISYRLQGKLDIHLVEKSLNELFKRHDILRTAFVYKDIERPVQLVLKERVIDFYYEDISKIGAWERKEVYIKEFKEEDKRRSFDLGKGVLMRVSILQVEELEYEFTWSFHHILMDGWCIGIINTEFFEIYTGYIENRPYRLPEVKPYRTYIQWLEKQDKEESARYWENYLDSYEEQAGVPKTKIVKEGNGYRNEMLSVILNREKTVELNKLAARNHVTLNTVTQTLWGILIGKYNRKEDVVFGAVVSGRPSELEGMESMVGLFINTIPVRIRFEGEMKFYRLIQQIQEEAIKGEPHHYHPLTEIQSRTTLKQNLIDHILIFENYPIAEQIEGYGREKDISGKISIKLANVDVFEQTNYDFNVLISGAERLKIIFQYNSNVYDKDFIKRIAKHFSLAFDQVIENQELEVRELTLLLEEEKNRILYEFNGTKADYPMDKTIHRLFEDQVERTPDNIAVIGLSIIHKSPVQITYRELNNKSNFLALLLKEKGVVPDTIVGIMAERTCEMIVGIFGILKAGGAYLPLDSEYPKYRFDYMLKDSGAIGLLTDDLFVESSGYAKRQKTFMSSTISSLCVQPNHLAYIIYTSGSTGNPKGVLVEHRSVVNLICSQSKYFNIIGSDRILQFSSICFDASVEQIFIALSRGAVLVLINKSMLLDVENFDKFIFDHQISHIHAVPSFLSSIHLKNVSRLKRVIAGGDICPLSLAEKWNTNLDFFFFYGPTETTVTSIEILVKDSNAFLSRLPIGKPISNTIVFLLDRWMKPAPIGLTGELYIGGAGVTRGYLNCPELTAEKFLIVSHLPLVNNNLPNYQSQMTILYKSGDLVRWLPNGNIEFLGRIDQQVKIRGFRIELEEIENQILKYPGIKETAVLAMEDEDGGAYLSVYAVTEKESSSSFEFSKLKKYLSVLLPDYMIPSYFIQLEKIPLTSSGKVDRKSLPKTGILVGKESMKPRNKVEKKMAEIWSQVLGIDSSHAPIGIDENFFELGGHSLKAMILLSRIHKELYVNISLAEMFETPTIKGLSEYIHCTSQDKFVSIKPVEEKEYHILSSAQKRLYFLHRFEVKSTAYNMPYILSLEAKINKDTLEETFIKLIYRHESLRTSFEIEKEEPVQRIHKNIEFEIEYHDFTEKNVNIHEEREAIIQNFVRPFDLTKAPLLRAGLIRIDSEKHILMVDMHHIISDGMSLEILAQDFSTLYIGHQLPKLNLQYKDYAEWQNCKREKEKLEAQGEFWQQMFEGEIPVLELPLDYARPAVQSFEGNGVKFEITGEAVEGLKRLTMEGGATLYMTLCSLYTIFLSKISGQEDIVIGAPVANRRHADLENVIGMFVNTLALRSYIPGDKKFTEYLNEVKENTLRAFENQEYQFEELIEKVSARRDVSRNPLFDVTFVLQNTFDITKREVTGDVNSGLNITPYFYKNEISKFDLSLNAVEKKESLIFQFQYRTKLFREETILKFIEYFKKIVFLALQTPGQKISEMEIITDEERKQILFNFNNTDSVFPKDKTIDEIFDEQVKKAPHQRAISAYLDLTLIYNELESNKEEIDEKLKNELGNCCFKKSSYVFQFEDRTFLAALNLFDQKEVEQLHLLKTHRDNYIAVNKETLLLLEYFNGKTNLKSMFSALVIKKHEFWIFSVVIDEPKGRIFHDRKKYSTDKSFSDLLILIKTLYRANLIELADYHSRLASIDIILFDRGSEKLNREPKSVEQMKTKCLPNFTGSTQKNKIDHTVLLLGDRTGTASTGLLYIASFLRRNGIRAYCRWNDLNKTTASLKENVLQLLSKIQPTIVGVSMKWFPHIARVLEICKIVKDYNPSIIVVVGGNTASFYKEEVIQFQTIDYIIAGDGEVPLLKLCLGEEYIPNVVYKKNGEIIINSIDYVQDDKNSSDIYFSHLDEIFVFSLDPFLAPYIYINTGKGCSQQCVYCAGCRDVQLKTFNRFKPFLRGIEEVRRDILESQKYTACFMYDFDLPLYDSLEYYTKIWQGIDLSRHFCIFYFWMLPEPDFIEIVTKTFNYVYINIDLCSLSERHRKKLSSLKLVKPQPSNDELFQFFDKCEEYNNVEVTINHITGLPYFTFEDIELSQKALSKIIEKYSCFRGMDWGRLHAQPGAPIIETPETYDMISYARTFDDFLYYSDLNLKEYLYPELLTFNYPYIYFNDEKLNSQISQYYIDATRKVEKNILMKRRNLELYMDMTYEELDGKAGILAGKLMEKGVISGDIVAICVDRSLEMIIGLLGILKAGGVYLPLDSRHPADRIKYMLEDSNTSILLTQKNKLESIPFEKEKIDIMDQALYTNNIRNSTPLKSINTPHSLAYVLYTSGSTGKPKGVMVEHRNVIRLIKDSNFFKWTEGDKLLLTGAISFDITTFEIWGPILNRLTLFLADQEIILNGKKLGTVLESNGISILHLIPQLFNQFVELYPNIFKKLKYLLVGGDIVKPYYINKIRSLYPHLKVLHMYGPTENTTFTTFLPVADNFEIKIPIGKPISNSTVYIIDKYGKLMPPGVVGELCVGGEGLARGYLNNPILTMEKFFKNPFVVEGKIYKTGDFARWLSDGNIEFLGRMDRQVKIRGFRIESGEIETLLLKHEGIDDAVVIANEVEEENTEGCSTDKSLYAYIVANKELSVLELKEYLSGKLPDYMIPAFFVQLQNMPLTPNGKIDVRSLPNAETKLGQDYIAPGNEIEEKLAQIWSETLGIEKEIISVNSNFFQLGGHSLKATKMVAKIHKEFDMEISLVDIFMTPTIKEIADLIGVIGWAENKKITTNTEREEMTL